jgi:hypothetical protein
MDKIKRAIDKSIKEWEKAKAEITERAKALYKEICEIIKDDPQLSGQATTILLAIYKILLEGKYIEALGYLSLLAMSLAYRNARKKRA